MTSLTQKDKLEEPEEKKDLNLIEPNLKGDWLNFFLLMLLYIMQGIPLGLNEAMPIILQTKKNITYQDQVVNCLSILSSVNLQFIKL